MSEELKITASTDLVAAPNGAEAQQAQTATNEAPLNAGSPTQGDSIEPLLSPEQAIEHVIDDESDFKDAVIWSGEQLLTGSTVEQIRAELEELGWPPARAEDVAETARRLTRAERGVITRADVARLEARRHSQAWKLAFFAGLPTWSAMNRLWTAIGHWRMMRTLRNDRAARRESAASPEAGNVTIPGRDDAA